MSFKIVLFVVATLLVLASVSDARRLSLARHRAHQVDDDVANHDDSLSTPSAGRQPHPASSRRGLSPKKGRVFPGAVAIKKLVLLKFKKIVPISLILLKSNNENEAELVPVYPTSEIPSNVQFIPTPNGISGHKDVQAIAIPSELHAQLEASGLANLENIESLFNEAAEVPSEEEDTVSMVGSMNIDEPLEVNETDVNQLLESVAVPEEHKTIKATTSTNLRRLAADDTSRFSLRAGQQQTAVEDIPLYLYSAKDSPVIHNNARLSGLRLATANAPPRRRLHA